MRCFCAADDQNLTALNPSTAPERHHDTAPLSPTPANTCGHWHELGSALSANIGAPLSAGLATRAAATHAGA